MFSQVDSEGHQCLLLEAIVDHRTNGNAITPENGWYTTKSGQRKRKITTAGWDFRVEWKDGSFSWVPLKDLRVSNPVEIAEYAENHGLKEQPAFAWWVHHVLKRRNSQIQILGSNS